MSTISQSLNILLVDDDQTIRSVFHEVLSMLNHRIIEASDGREAIDIVDRIGHTLDLLVTDICMPELDGVSLVRHVRETHADLPIAVMTGYADSEMIKQVERYNTHLFHKPVDYKRFEQFLATLS